MKRNTGRNRHDTSVWRLASRADTARPGGRHSRTSFIINADITKYQSVIGCSTHRPPSGCGKCLPSTVGIPGSHSPKKETENCGVMKNEDVATVLGPVRGMRNIVCLVMLLELLNLFLGQLM